METSEECVICKQSTGTLPKATLTEKGSGSINKASKERKDTLFCSPGQKVHQECRRKYCKPDQIAKALRSKEQQVMHTNTEKQVLRSAEKVFNFSTNCFYCGEPAITGRKRKGTQVIAVRTVETKDTILAICHERGDDWAKAVQARILHVHDLHAADAVYHRVCSVNFRTMKQVPVIHDYESNTSKKLKLGRPPEKQQADAFIEVAQFLEENDDEQITIHDLIQRMEENLGESELSAYSYPYMKQRLAEHFGDKIIETEINGKPNVITFRNKAKEVLYDFYSHQDLDPEKDKLRIIETAAKLIKDDIKAVKTSHSSYPSFDELKAEECINFLPVSLKTLLTGLFVGKETHIKIASIGQAMMQATRPRVLLAPLQIGLGVQLHHLYASRFLIDTFHKHGFCCSYNEVHQFEQNAVLSYGTDIPNHSTQFVQYVADNVDHNIKTLDGNNTFHGMGMIATITPANNKSNQILRVKVTPKDIATIGRVPIQFHTKESLGMTMVTYEKLYSFKGKDSTAKLDLLWKSSIMLESPRPAWSGMMQLVHSGRHPGTSSVMFLPLIDMNPSDTTCVYSTLKYIQEHADRHNVTPIITFDQPLWWKALMITVNEPVGSKLRSIVLRLGGFHTEMSFLGCIGHLMAASGLQELLELIYAPNAVLYMLSGKAIARAVRGHFIVDSALNALILASTFNVPIPGGSEIANNEIEEVTETIQTYEGSTSKTDHGLLEEAAVLYKKLMQGLVSAAQVCQDNVMIKMDNVLQANKELLKSSRTAAMWIQYMDMIDILRKHIRAERTGNWELHLQAVSEMLPYLAASGHNNYTKSAMIYLQHMSHLQDDHPEVYQHFQDGLHVIRRSDRYWAGLSSDLVIEQVLMRSLKTNGGLTRGQGMTEQQRLIWSLSMPACGEMNKTMQELTGVSYNSGEQNKDLTQARQARDWKDTKTLLSYLHDRNPFTSDPSLRSICTGVHAHSTVNVDKAKDVGDAILVNMDGEAIVWRSNSCF